MPENNYVKENKSSLEKWKSLSNAVGKSEIGQSSGFDCNICLDAVYDPVVTLCGHLYCWPCIYKWINHQNASSEMVNLHNPQCPVCKRDISQKTLVPLYGRGHSTQPHTDEKSLDLGMVIPSRPHGPSCGTHTLPTQQHIYRAYQQLTGLTTTPNVINPTSPTTGMLGEMVYQGVFGNTHESLYVYPNSYNLVPMSTQRSRRQAMQVDRSLGRICFFLFCCIMACLILF